MTSPSAGQEVRGSGGQVFSPAHPPDLLRHLARQVQVNQHVLPLQVFQLNDALNLE